MRKRSKAKVKFYKGKEYVLIFSTGFPSVFDDRIKVGLPTKDYLEKLKKPLGRGLNN